MYIHERKGWPKFVWDREKIASLLIQVRHSQGLLLGGMRSVGFEIRDEVILCSLTQDVVKSSEIEGEMLDETLVRSSVARKLGMDVAADRIDRHIEGVVEMMLDATQKYERPLTRSRLFVWHSLLFPQGRSGYKKIRTGSWRKEPVQVVSRRSGREIIHFEGPEAERVNVEMKQFLTWLNGGKGDQVLKAAIAHLWFVAIHPFDDGNGRISRAIADLLLTRSEKSPRRFYSLSSQIQEERKTYYQILEKTQKDGLNITDWIEWFLLCLMRAIEKALSTLEAVKHKEQVWKSLAKENLNERQRKVLSLLMDGFQGKLTSSKWAKVTNCSQDTAYQDILDLIDRGILTKSDEGGRSTSYDLRDTVN